MEEGKFSAEPKTIAEPG
jgi:hypothetical protein